jgi:D-xylonolactonase
MANPVLLVDSQCENAEGPLWHPLENCLYWTDIPAGKMYRYHFDTKTHEQIYQGEPVGGYTIQSDGSLLLFKTKGIIEHWHQGKTTPIINLPEAKFTRFNDTIADPLGRVFCGTMATGDRTGHLYRIDLDGSITKVLETVSIPNGMAFTPDRKGFYFTDSTNRQIYLFDYDIDSGTISHQRTVVTVTEGEPDGLTVDNQGYIWSARWDGSHLFRFSPQGEEVMRIPFPAKKVSSVTFGGPNYDQMFITTAGGGDRATEGSGAGAIFQLQLGITGLPEFFSQIKL